MESRQGEVTQLWKCVESTDMVSRNELGKTSSSNGQDAT